MSSIISYGLSIGALELLPEEGRVLKSGRVSPYFFNSGLFNTGGSLWALGLDYAHAASKTHPDVLFGPAYKGIPLVSVTAVIMSEELGENVGIAFNRKEAKDHGEGGLLVGAPLKNKRVAILDDVITTGGSSSQSCQLIREAGGVPVACIIAFDRQERGLDNTLSAIEEFEKREQVPVYAAATLDDLIKELEENPGEYPLAAETLPKIREYKNAYGLPFRLQP